MSYAEAHVSSTLTIRLPDDLRSELEAICKAENKPLSDIVRESLRRYVAIQQFRYVRRKVLPFAEAQGLLTDEDIFDAIS
jgi:predicted transcriptional regulator